MAVYRYFKLSNPPLLLFTVLVAPVMIPVQYSGMDRYTTLDTYFNKSLYARLLTPIPSRCPTPMGTKGPKALPPVAQVVEKVYKRHKCVCIMQLLRT